MDQLGGEFMEGASQDAAAGDGDGGGDSGLDQRIVVREDFGDLLVQKARDLGRRGIASRGRLPLSRLIGRTWNFLNLEFRDRFACLAQ